ncbi:MAG: prenyltransferase [Eubacterium sp.]
MTIEKKETGFRDSLAREGIRARTTKCPYITSGEATVKQTLLAAVTFGILALIPGAVIFAFRGWVIAVIVLIAVVLGESYSGEPLRLSYRGLGEPDIGVMFGTSDAWCLLCVLRTFFLGSGGTGSEYGAARNQYFICPFCAGL